MVTIDQRLARLEARGVEIHPTVIDIDIPTLYGRIPEDDWEQVVDAMLSTLEALADGKDKGRRLARRLRNFRRVAFSSGLPSLLDPDMRIIFQVDGNKKVIYAIGKRDTHNLQQDIYTRLTQRLPSP